MARSLALASQPCVRWRLNANGVEWFWGGHWWSTNNLTIAANLVREIEAVTASYPQSKPAAQQAAFEERLLKALS